LTTVLRISLERLLLVMAIRSKKQLLIFKVIIMKKILLELFSHNSLYFFKIDLHFLSVRIINLMFFKDPQKIKQKASFLNIGCGEIGLDNEDWFNLDGWPAKGVDYNCDLRKNLPFEDSRFRGIYSEHFFEHLCTEDAQNFLLECNRILQLNGSIRLSVPDGELYLKNYFADKQWMIEQIEDRGWMHESGRKVRTSMELVNDVFRQKLQHQYCYDFETISLLLAEAGFQNICRVNFGSGCCHKLQIDREERRLESLYVEAQKP
jgi:predicted SAM-dependent methyltransferase